MTDIPKKGDRSAWDDLGYPLLHAVDLSSGIPTHHLPADADTSEVPIWDGEKWVNNKMSSDIVDTVVTNFDGALSSDEDTVQKALDILDDYVYIDSSAFAGLLSAADDTVQKALETLDAVSIAYPKTATIWHDQCEVVSGGARTTGTDATQQYQVYAYQSSSGNGDKTRHGFIIAAGTYTLRFLHLKYSTYGKLDVSIDGGSVLGTIDMYAGSLQRNVETEITGVVLTDGYHTLDLTVNGKNGSSGGYDISITKIGVIPSAY